VEWIADIPGGKKKEKVDSGGGKRKSICRNRSLGPPPTKFLFFNPSRRSREREPKKNKGFFAGKPCREEPALLTGTHPEMNGGGGVVLRG